MEARGLGTTHLGPSPLGESTIKTAGNNKVKTQGTYEIDSMIPPRCISKLLDHHVDPCPFVGLLFERPGPPLGIVLDGVTPATCAKQRAHARSTRGRRHGPRMGGIQTKYFGSKFVFPTNGARVTIHASPQNSYHGPYFLLTVFVVPVHKFEHGSNLNIFGLWLQWEG